MQHLLKVNFIRNRMYHKALSQFLQKQADDGIQMRNAEIPERLVKVKTVLVDASLIMQGDDGVKRVTAPLVPCDLSRFKHQSAWMMLTAGVALGCEGYAPLERFAESMNFARARMMQQFPEMERIPYDSIRRMETTVHKDAGGIRAFSKGDPEAIVSRCAYVMDGKERVMGAADRRQVLSVAEDMEKEGMHTLAFATSWREEPEAFEETMVFLGLVGSGDLPREGAAWSMQAFRGAGVRPTLVSPAAMTPGAVRMSGVLTGGQKIISGGQVEAMSDEVLAQAAEDAGAFVEMDWQKKMRLLRALRTGGQVALISPEPEYGGLVLSLAGKEPDVVFDAGELDAVVRLLGDCRTLAASYQKQ